MEEYPRPKSDFEQWLDQTQRESWQLELIFSGFVVFLLIAGLGPYHELGETINQLTQSNEFFIYLDIPYTILKAAYYFLIVAILFHVFLRGLWISTIGLRSVSGNIDWDQFRLNTKFRRFLENGIKSFDHYISEIEKYCSISFAFTFLMIFSICGLGGFVFTAVVIESSWHYFKTGRPFQGTSDFDFGDVLLLTYFMFALIYLIDFLTLTRLKRLKWLRPVYFPIYRFFGYITFAHLYRPIYYNLVDNRLGRRLVVSILPFTMITIVLMSIQYQQYAFLPHSARAYSDQWYLVDSYEDTRREGSIGFPSINSKIISNNHLELFVPYVPNSHDNTITKVCPDIEPGHFTGIKLRSPIRIGEIYNDNQNSEELLICMKKLWRVSIDDSLYTDVNFRFYYHAEREQPGLLALIPIRHLNHEEHYVKIDRYRVYNDSLQWHDGRNIWFYRE